MNVLLPTASPSTASWGHSHVFWMILEECFAQIRHSWLFGWNRAPRAGAHRLPKDVSSSRGLTGYREDYVAIKKPPKLTQLYSSRSWYFSEKETASGMLSVSMSHHKNPAPSSTPKRRNQLKSWFLPSNFKSSYMTKLLSRHPNSKAQGNVSWCFLWEHVCLITM